MDKKAVRAKFDEACLNKRKWADKNGVPYGALTMMLSDRSKRISETRLQRKIIDCMVADGLYVPSSEDGR